MSAIGNQRFGSDDHDLLAAVVATIHAIHDDIIQIGRTIDLIRAAQIEHGTALEHLRLRVDRHLWDVRGGSATTPAPRPMGGGIGGGDGE